MNSLPRLVAPCLDPLYLIPEPPNLFDQPAHLLETVKIPVIAILRFSFFLSCLGKERLSGCSTHGGVYWGDARKGEALIPLLLGGL